MGFNFDPRLQYEKDEFDHLDQIDNTDVWVTPGDAADPTDCDRYPDSPWCGGQPWSRTPFGFGWDIDISNCYIGVGVTPIIGWTSMPIQQIYWINPKCRPRDIELAKPESKPIPFPRADLDKRVAILVNTQYEWTITTEYSDGYIFKRRRRNDSKFDSYSWDKNPEFRMDITFTGRSTYEVLEYENPRPTYYGHPVHPVLTDNSRSKTSLNTPPLLRSTSVVEQEIQGTHNIYYPNDASSLLDPNSTRTSAPLFIQGIYWDCIRWLQWMQDRANWVEKWGNETSILKCEYKVVTVLGVPLVKPPPPPPPRRRKREEDEEEDMKCCDKVLSRLARLERAVGIRDLPVSLPELLSRKNGNDAKTVKDDSLAKLLVRQALYFDDLMGQWEIPIEIKDADLLKDGDQKKTIKLPNLAEAVAEMFGIVFSTSMNVEASLQLLVKSMMTQSQDFKTNIESRYYVEAIADYLGFPRNEKKKFVDILINPKAPELDDFYDTSQMEVIVPEYEEEQNLKHDLKQLLLAAAIVKAQGTRSFNPRLDMAAQILDLLKKNSGAIDEVNRGKGTDADKDDFDNFLEEAERGFIDTAGITDTVNPYGKPYSQRPRIREIGGNAGGT